MWTCFKSYNSNNELIARYSLVADFNLANGYNQLLYRNIIKINVIVILKSIESLVEFQC